MKKIILRYFLFLTVLMFFSGCGKLQPLKEDKIMESIPEELLFYSLGGQDGIMSIKKITIDKRQTNEKEDIVYAVINMEDNCMHRTAYYIFFYNYYDTGGWILDNWEPYQDAIDYPISPPSDNVVYANVSEYYNNYECVSVDTDTLENGYCTFIFNISDVRANVSYFGEVGIMCRFVNDLENRYHWEYELEEYTLLPEWNITGTWTAEIVSEMFGELDSYYLMINITDVADTIVTANGKFGYTGSIYEDWRDGIQFNTTFEYSMVKDDGESTGGVEQSDEVDSLSFAIDTSGWRVYFTADGASAQYAGHPRAELLKSDDVQINDEERKSGIGNEDQNDWYLKEGESGSENAFKIHNNKLFSNDIWYSSDELVVEDNYACWHGADVHFNAGIEYASPTIFVICFDENEKVRSAEFFSFMDSKEDAECVVEQHKQEGYYKICNVVIYPYTGEWIIGETTKQDVINYYEKFGMNVQYY